MNTTKAMISMWCAFIAMGQAFADNVPTLDLIQAHGPKLFAGGKEIRLRGSNLGNWLLQEDFMFGLAGTHSQMRGAMATVLGKKAAAAFWDEYEKVYFTAADARFLAQQGYNFLRVPLNQNRFEDPNDPGQYDQAALRQVDAVVRLCKENGIYVLVDLHAVPGGQSREIYADSLWATPEFWRYADFRKRSTDFWVMLAKRYKDEKAVAGYDLINEPNTEGRTDLLTAWHRETIRQIRTVDPVHLIWLSGDNYGKGFIGLPEDLFADEQVVFQFHIYPSFTYPLWKMKEYPQTVDGIRYDKAWLRERLREQIAFGKRRPVLLGEFGFSFNKGNIPLLQAMIKDLLAVCDEEGWSWAQWSYKDVGVMGLLSPTPETPWKRFLASAEVQADLGRANELFAVRGVSAPSTGRLAASIGSIATNLDTQVGKHINLSARRICDDALSQAILYHLKDKDEATFRDLARSFAFENCRTNPPLAENFLRKRAEN